MKNSKGFGLVELLIAVVMLAIVAGWYMNLYKLVQCDFEAPYKVEIIRLAGLIPPVGGVVGWIDINDK